MNQILDYGENEQNTSLNQESINMSKTIENQPKNNGKNIQAKSMEDYYQKTNNDYPNQLNSNGSKDNKKNIKIFAIVLGVFAIISLIIVAVIVFVGPYFAESMKSKISGTTKEFPEILMVENEKTIEITATYTSNLEKLIYTWGENPDLTIPGEGKNLITASIEKPIGTHVLKIKIVAQDGNEAFKEKEYTQERGPDVEKPKINFLITDSKKLKITVRDNVGIETFKYYWNEEEPIELIEAKGRTEASVEVEILKGRNVITVIAIDESGLESIEEKEYTGKEAPIITMYLTQDQKNVILTATHEKGISEIIIILNDKEDKKTYEGDLIKEEVKLQIKLKPGDNILEVQVKSVDGETASIKGSATAPKEEGSVNIPTE